MTISIGLLSGVNLLVIAFVPSWVSARASVVVDLVSMVLLLIFDMTVLVIILVWCSILSWVGSVEVRMISTG